MDTREIIMPIGGTNNDFLGGGGIGSLLIGALLFGGRGFGGWGGYGMPGGPAASAVATDVVLNPAFQSLQSQIQTLQGQVSNHQLEDSIQSFQSDAANNWNNINANINGVTRDLSNSIANLATAQATGNFTTLNSINGLGRDVTASQNQAALQQLNSFNNLTTSMLQGFNGLAMQSQNDTNQVIGQLRDMTAQQAACCCDLKQAIFTDGNSTRALINDLNVQSLRDQLAAANNKVSNNEQNQYLLSTILMHLKPENGSK